MLAPRLNAAGRMSSPDLALDLLLLRGRDADVRAQRARTGAAAVGGEHRRQEQEAAILAEARRLDRRRSAVGAQNLLVVAGDGWHRGVIGIVASKLVDTYHKPALVLSIEDGVARGSGRSIPRFDLLAGLEACADVFLRFGGHKQAAGVTLEAARIDELRRRLTPTRTSGWRPTISCRGCASTRRSVSATSRATSWRRSAVSGRSARPIRSRCSGRRRSIWSRRRER